MDIYVTVKLSIFQGTIKSIFSDIQNNFFFLFREMKFNSISRIQYHSVIRSPKTKTASIQHNGKKMVKTAKCRWCPSENINYYLVQIVCVT